MYKIRYLILFLLAAFSNLCQVTADSSTSSWIFSNGGLSIRDKPSHDSQRLAIIPFGEEISILEEMNNELTISERTGHWVRSSWNGLEGWVFSAYLIQYPVNAYLSGTYRYEIKPEPYESLVLSSNSFSIAENHCTDIIWVSGKYIIENEKLVLFKINGESDEKFPTDISEADFILDIRDDNRLVLTYLKNFLGCGPLPGTVFLQPKYYRTPTFQWEYDS